MSDEMPKPSEADEAGAVTLMLGLYLIMLAFFILLNAISESSEEKAKQVAESVAEGFGFQLDGPVNMRDDVEVTINPVFDQIARDIQGIIESHVAIKNFRLSSSDGNMVLRIKSTELFAPRRVRIRPEMADLFTDLGDLIATSRPGMKMEAEVLVNGLEAEARGTKLSPQELAGRRATLFVRALIERGVDERALTAMAIESRKPEVKLFFKTHVVDEVEALKEARKIIRRQRQSGPMRPGAKEKFGLDDQGRKVQDF